MLKNTPDNQMNTPVNQFGTHIKGGDMDKNLKSTPFEEMKKKDQLEYWEEYRDTLREYYASECPPEESTSNDAIYLDKEMGRVDEWIKLLKMTN